MHQVMAQDGSESWRLVDIKNFIRVRRAYANACDFAIN